MRQSVFLTGMVLQTMAIGDYDKRITLLTKERGKINAFAKGVRRPNSSLLAASAPFSFGEFELYEGRSSYNVKKAEISNYFRELTTDLDNTYYGFYFLEMADYFTQENNDEREVLKLLYLSLKAVENPNIPNRLVRCIFEWKMMVINGMYPNTFSCQLCGKEEQLAAFSVKHAGMLCNACSASSAYTASSGESGILILESTLYTMQYVITAELKKLYTFNVSEEVLIQLERILGRYMEKYVGHKFKSEKFLQDGENHFVG